MLYSIPNSSKHFKVSRIQKKTPIILDRIITDWTFILLAPSRQRSPSSSSLRDKLQKLQNRAARVLTFSTMMPIQLSYSSF